MAGLFGAYSLGLKYRIWRDGPSGLFPLCPFTFLYNKEKFDESSFCEVTVPAPKHINPRTSCRGTKPAPFLRFPPKANVKLFIVFFSNTRLRIKISGEVENLVYRGGKLCAVKRDEGLDR